MIRVLTKILTTISILSLLFFVAKHKNNFIQETETATLHDVSQIQQEETIHEEIASTSAVTTKPNELKQSETVVKPQETDVKTTQSVSISMHSDTDESYIPETSPCKKPLGFKIGNFDQRFQMSKDEFLTKTKLAAELWNNSSAQKVLYYNQDGEITVNLIYDERQANTDERNYLALEIENSKQTADSLQSVFENERKKYDESVARLRDDIQAFQTKKATYEAKVAEYNKNGGAPQKEYEEMTLELANLKSEAANLDTRQNELEQQAKNINEKVAKYNKLVQYINELVSKTNKLGGYKFTEGRFSPRTNTIDIFQFENTTKLVRVLAHEFGHALGINHTKNPNSIMFAMNTGTSTTLTKEDVSALQAVCGAE
jgi:phage shock protein A